METRKILFNILIVLFSIPVFAQNISGLAVYQIKLVEDDFIFEGTLNFNESESIFTTKKSKNPVLKMRGISEDDTNMRQEDYSDSLGHIYYTLLPRKKMFVRTFCQKSSPVIYQDSINIKWKIHKETKKINNIQCLKATTKFRGRFYEAWFASEIPISAGPWKFNGLPGLIIQISDKSQKVAIYLTSLKIENILSKIEFDKNLGTLIKRKEFYDCLEIEWEKENDRYRAAFNQIAAEAPELEMSLEIDEKRAVTELNFK